MLSIPFFLLLSDFKLKALPPIVAAVFLWFFLIQPFPLSAPPWLGMPGSRAKASKVPVKS
jgi:hypothetical protein